MADGETFETWMATLRPHFVKAHADVMHNANPIEANQEKMDS